MRSKKTMAEGKHKYSRWFRILLWTGSVALALFIGLNIFVRTEAFCTIVRDQIISAAAENLNGTLRIGGLEGDFFTNIRVLDASVLSNDETVVRLSRLEIEFSLLPLLRKEIHIGRILVDSLTVSLRQINDTTWNLNTLVKADPDTSTSEFTWLVTIGSLNVHDARMNIAPLDTSSLIPRHVDDINAQLSGAYSSSVMDMNVEYLRLHTRRPSITLRQFSFTTKKEGDDLVVRDMILQTERNRLDANARISTDSLGSTEAAFNLDSLDFSEFAWAMQGETISRKPDIDASVWFRHDSLHVNAEITESHQQLTAEIGIGKMESLPQYRFTCNIKNIDAGAWLNDTTMKSRLNGDLRGWWQGSDVEKASFRMEGGLSKSTLMRRSIDQLDVQAIGNNGTIDASATLRGQFGSMAVAGRVSDVTKTQVYTLSGTTTNLDIAPLLLNDSLRSNLTMAFSANGSGFSPDTMMSDVRITLEPSQAGGLSIEKGLAQFHISKKQYRIDTLDLRSSIGNVHAAGVVDLEGESNLQFDAAIATLAPLAGQLGADTLSGAVAMRGSVTGRKDSLTIVADASVGQMQFNSIRIDSIDASFNVQRQEILWGEFSGRATNVTAGTMFLDSISINADLDERLRIFLVSFHGDNRLRGDLALRYSADSTRIRIDVPTIMVGYKETELRGGGDSMWIEITGYTYTLHDVSLASGNQRLAADGHFSLTGTEDLVLTVRNLDLANMLELANINQKAGGMIDASLELTGTASDPKLDGRVSIANGFVNALQYQSLTCSLQYGEKKFRWTSDLSVTPDAKLIAKGVLPLSLSFTDTGRVLLDDQPMEAELKSQGLSLNVLQAGSDQVKAEGGIECDLKITNTLVAPKPFGHLAITNGKFEYPEFGIEYQDIQFRVDVSDDSLSLTRCDIKTGDGSLKGSGRVKFGSGVVGGDIRSTVVNFTASNFVAADDDDIELVIDGTARLGGDMRSLEYGGNLNVVRSSVWLPKFTDKMNEQKARTALPLLVKATQRTDTLQTRRAVGDEEDAFQFDYIKNLHGSLTFTIPKNTWLRSPDMQIEIAGDMEVEKTGANFELIGEIRTVRGWYEVLGKRFEIEQGTLFFQGGKEYNPDLDIDAAYTFRDENREERVLGLHITGKAYTPKFDFSLDDKKIELSDAVAYVTFGRPFNSLSFGQKSSASEQGLALGLAARQLSSALGRASGLDVLEIRGGETIGQSSIAVGKYISNDLFMSVEKQFGSGESGSPATQIITLEYELTKFLFLQLIQGDQKNSGFDIFLKLEK